MEIAESLGMLTVFLYTNNFRNVVTVTFSKLTSFPLNTCVVLSWVSWRPNVQTMARSYVTGKLLLPIFAATSPERSGLIQWLSLFPPTCFHLKTNHRKANMTPKPITWEPLTSLQFTSCFPTPTTSDQSWSPTVFTILFSTLLPDFESLQTESSDGQPPCCSLCWMSLFYSRGLSSFPHPRYVLGVILTWNPIFSNMLGTISYLFYVTLGS